MPYHKHRKYWHLFYILLLTLSLFAPTRTEAALTEAEQAAIWFSQNKEERALKLLKKVWLRDGKSPKFGLGAGVGYAYHLGEYGKRLKDKGELKKANQYFQKSIQVFEIVIERFPATDAADFELAILYKDKMDDLPTAIITLERLYSRFLFSGLHVRIIKDYAGALLGVQGDQRKEALRKALVIIENYSPEKSEFYDYSVIYADTLFENQLYDKAINHYKTLTELKPELSDFPLKLAKCYRKVNSLSNAASLYEDLKFQFPNNGRIWFENGILMYEMGDREKAISELNDAISVYKRNDDIKGQKDVANFLDELDWLDAKTKMSQQDFETACPQLYDIYIRNERKQYGVDTAVCYREYKKYDVANIFFKKLVIQYPDDSNLFLEFYESLKKQKKTNYAKELLLEYVGEYGYVNPQVVSRLAAIYLGEEKYQLSLDTLMDGYESLVIQDVPLAFHFIAGNAHRGLGNMEAAKKSFQTAKEAAPDLLSAHMELFSTVQTSGDVTDIQILLAEMHDQFGMTNEVRLKRAALSLMQQSWHKVVEDCDVVLDNTTLTKETKQVIGTAKALKLDASIEIAKIMFAEGQGLEAVQVFQDLYFQKQDRRNAVNLAVFASKIGESARADALLSKQLSVITDPAESDVVKSVWAEILLMEHQAPKVLEVLDMNIGKDHVYHPILSLLLVKSLSEMARWKELKDTLQGIQSQMIDSDNAFKSTAERELPENLWSQAATVAAVEKDYVKARMYWRKLEASKKDPDLSAYMLEVVNLYIQENNYNEAKSILDDLVQQYPNDPMVYKTYANYYQKVKNPEQWESSLQRALELFKSQDIDSYWLDIERQVQIGSTYFGMGDLKSAEEVFLSIVEEIPYYFKAHETLGYLYLEMKDYTKAEQSFKTAQSIQPKNPLIIQALALAYFKSGDPIQSKFWEDKTLIAAQDFGNVVTNLRSNSLGVYGYRLVPNVGTTFGASRLTARPDAMVLVRESAFSDQEIAGFRIDQTVLKQNTAIISAAIPTLWLNLTRVSSSGSLDTIVNVVDLNAHWRYNKKNPEQVDTTTVDNSMGARKFSGTNGILQIRPSGVLVFENEKYAETDARIFPMGSLSLTYLPSKTNLLVETKGGYGKQRLDKYGLPTIFFHGSSSVAWGKGLKSIYGSVGARRDKTPAGVNFSTFVTETAFQKDFGWFVPSTFIKTESLFGLPKLGNAFGYAALFKLTTTPNQIGSGYVTPYSSMNVSGSIQYPYGQVYQFDAGLKYENSFMWPTRQGTDWYSYGVPWSINLAYQRFWYPKSSVPMSQTVLFSFRII